MLNTCIAKHKATYKSDVENAASLCSCKLRRRDLYVEIAAVAAVVAASSPLDGFSAAPIDPEKRILGQYFTEKRCWMLQHIRDFIIQSGCNIVYDPFCGSGCLLRAVKDEIPTVSQSKGLDIDKTLGWEYNDSLISIPHIDNAIIVTNPPYISNYSARRKKISANLEKYFKSSCYDDVYLIALDRMLAAQDMVVAIIPETFINSSYKQKNRLHSITILEDNPFEDTDTPVVVACFDGVAKDLDKIGVYKNSKYVCSLGDVEKNRLAPQNTIKMKFNAPNGWLAVRCVDNTDPSDRLRFAFKENIDYDWEKGIKVSSRLLTLVEIDIPEESRGGFIAECNRRLEKLRVDTHDVVLSPFKGNMKNGVRRRRLDFQTCRAIIEEAYDVIFGGSTKPKQGELF